ncbi:hypothetical protein BGZ91_008325 [Linnemannia elongata]|nr:hypothetical protein BGZ91_008325 [Linnemannia elongata]
MANQSVVDAFVILGSFSTFFISIVLLLWTSLSDTELARDLWNWLGDVYYGEFWYGEYNSILKGRHYCCPCLWCIEQPVLEANMVQLDHFGHVPDKPSSQTCWTILPDLASVGSVGVKHDANEAVRRDPLGRVMLKVNLEDLMQLLLRGNPTLNWDNPWSGRPWRQKTSYGFVELNMANSDMLGLIKIDPIPYNSTTHGSTLTGKAIQELWEKGYTGFPDDLFQGADDPDSCLALRSSLNHLTIGTHSPYALTPQAFSSILHHFCMLFGNNGKNNDGHEIDESDKVCTRHTCRITWNDVADDTGILAARLQWQGRGVRSQQNDVVETIRNLAELASKMRRAALSIDCDHELCDTRKKMCKFLYDMLHRSFDCKFAPDWAHKHGWFGPNAVYFGGPPKQAQWVCRPQ